jgi:hypothetical protein
MALPRRQQRLLEAIEHQMTSADPRLAWMLGTFGRLWADEPLPAREQLPTRTSRFWPGLWEAFALGAWPAPPLTDPPMTRCRRKARRETRLQVHRAGPGRAGA